MEESLTRFLSLSEVLWGFFFCIGKGDARTRDSKVGKRGQGNFKLAANFGYRSRGSADPRESLRKRRILQLALNAHKVFADLGVPCPSCVLADTRKEEPGLLKKWEKRW